MVAYCLLHDALDAALLHAHKLLKLSPESALISREDWLCTIVVSIS